MDKLKMQSMDKIQEHIDAILKIFPSVATEAKSPLGGGKTWNRFRKITSRIS